MKHALLFLTFLYLCVISLYAGEQRVSRVYNHITKAWASYPEVTIHDLQYVPPESLRICDSLQYPNGSHTIIQWSRYNNDTVTITALCVVPYGVLNWAQRGFTMLLYDTTANPYPWGGILVFVNYPDTGQIAEDGFKSIERGDIIQLTGYVNDFPTGSFNSATEFYPVPGFAIHSLGTKIIPPPAHLEIKNFYKGAYAAGGRVQFTSGEPYEFMMVVLTNCLVVNLTTTGPGRYVFTMVDNSDSGNQITTYDASRWWTTRPPAANGYVYRDPASTYVPPSPGTTIDAIVGYMAPVSGIENLRGYRITPVFPYEGEHSSFVYGMIFNDLNGNGVKDNGEPGIPNWRIQLFSDNGYADSALTDALGKYTLYIYGSQPGMYTVREQLEPNWKQTAPSTGEYNIQVDTPTVIRGKDFGFVHSISKTVAVRNRWNIVSLPVQVSNDSLNMLFPTSTSTAWGYDGSKYMLCDVLKHGSGYWLKFGESQDVTIMGFPYSLDTIQVLKGWNLIGSISQSIAASSITSDPAGIVTSSFFGYNGNYLTTDTIFPGKGCWVKVSQSGLLILRPGTMSLASNRIKIVATSELPPPPLGEAVFAPPKIPAEFALEQNYPNPFNPNTTIKYQLPFDGRVTLKVYDVLGQIVATLAEEIQSAGYKSVEWNVPQSRMASGIYFYRLDVTGIKDIYAPFTQIKKMIILK